LLDVAKYNGSDTLETIQGCVGDDGMVIVDVHGRVTCSMLEDCDLPNMAYIKLSKLDFLNLCSVPEDMIIHEMNESLKLGDEIHIYMANRLDEKFNYMDSPQLLSVVDRVELGKLLKFFR
jgi:hypothetical protein